jgi:hypothetical protein
MLINDSNNFFCSLGLALHTNVSFELCVKVQTNNQRMILETKCTYVLYGFGTVQCLFNLTNLFWTSCMLDPIRRFHTWQVSKLEHLVTAHHKIINNHKLRWIQNNSDIPLFGGQACFIPGQTSRGQWDGVKLSTCWAILPLPSKKMLGNHV